jgi:hypothetical protein
MAWKEMLNNRNLKDSAKSQGFVVDFLDVTP